MKQNVMGNKMAQRTLTINLPGSPERLQDLIAFLLKQDILSEKEAQIIGQQKKTNTQPKKKGRWALAAKRLRAEGFLGGQGEEAKELIRDFRENFDL